MKSVYLFAFLALTIPALAQNDSPKKESKLPRSERSDRAIASNEMMLEKAMKAKGMALGEPIFIRIFKESEELEVWVKATDQTKYQLFKTYNICSFSGDLGPKTKQGDLQSPEGFYFVNSQRFNPWSRFHLSLNMGYPNTYDRSKGYTGNYLMIHGDCVSIGCYAMTNKGIEEIYTLAYKAVENGQDFFRIHSFPFRMTANKMAEYANHKWFGFWQNLKTGYDWFEEKGSPPNVEVSGGQYVFN